MKFRAILAWVGFSSIYPAKLCTHSTDWFFNKHRVILVYVAWTLQNYRTSVCRILQNNALLTDLTQVWQQFWSVRTTYILVVFPLIWFAHCSWKIDLLFNVQLNIQLECHGTDFSSNLILYDNQVIIDNCSSRWLNILESWKLLHHKGWM